MRIAILAAAAALALPFAGPAFAKSLHETHQLVWAQAGKTPALHYRPLDGKPACDRPLAGPVAAKGAAAAQPVADARCATGQADQPKADAPRGH